MSIRVFIKHETQRQQASNPEVTVLLGTIQINDEVYEHEPYAKLWESNGKWVWYVFKFGRLNSYSDKEESYEEAWNKVQSCKNLN